MDHVTLNNGVSMPILGFGVYQIPPRDTERCVVQALEVGYRLIDTALEYGNEEGVGRAIARSGIPRDEVFVTSKVSFVGGYLPAKQSIEQQLRQFGHDYFDLLLIHWPTGPDKETYRALEEAYAAGKARAIGLSNFFRGEFTEIADECEVVPAVNQIETHVFRQQLQARQLHDRYGTVTESWAPFAEGKNGLFRNPVLTAIGESHGKTPAQVALRFLVQSGVVAIPKTIHRERMVENLDIFDFSLAPHELDQIADLEVGQSFFPWGW